MAAPTDFLRLYQELGLAPGASFDDLKRAYRRRVSELHPDRAGQLFSATLPGAAERLQHITQLYDAALQFYRRHGRLPGAPPSSNAPAPADAPTSTQRRESVSAAPRRGRLRARLLLLAVAGVLVWFLVSLPWSSSPDEEETTMPAEDVPALSRAAPLPVERHRVGEARTPGPEAKLDRGMRAAEVLKLEGMPLTRSDEHWDYGPSWISFERGRVTGWYSSPLKPLRHATRYPPPEPPPPREEEPLP